MSAGGRIPAFERLTPEQYGQLIALIRAGAYDHVAAQAVGVTRETFARWLSIGQRARGGKYRQFYLDVQQARAFARARAEVKVLELDPRFWLRYGPGKEDWTEESSVRVTSTVEIDQEEVEQFESLLNQAESVLTVLEQAGILRLSGPAPTAVPPDALPVPDGENGR